MRATYIRSHTRISEDKCIALKIEKTYELALSNTPPPDEHDFTIALITKGFKITCVKSKNKKYNGDKENCFRCGKKSHFAKDCMAKLQDVMEPQQNKQAMVARGGSDDDSAEESTVKETCLMAKIEDTSTKITTNIFSSDKCESLTLKSRTLNKVKKKVCSGHEE